MDMEIRFPGGKKVSADFNGFTVDTDQPKDEGGDGTAPQPYDLFLASLGTCAGIYVLSFCRERKIPTEEIRVTMTAEKNEKSHLFEKVDVHVSLPPDFPSKYVSAVVKAAELCTVKRSIMNPPQFQVFAEKRE